MLKELSIYENLGSPKYFYELLNSLKVNSHLIWSLNDAEQLFHNKNINGRTVFDGCLNFAINISVLIIDESNRLTLNDNIINCLSSEIQMRDKIAELLFHSLKKDDVFHSIFSSDNISYDIIYHSTQINNSAFGFRYSNFKQLLIDFEIIQIHPTKKINKFILNPRFKKIFDKVILPEIRKRKVGVDEFRKRMEQQQINGIEAELFVLQYEKNRLKGKNGIDWVAEYSIAEGYDISSFQDLNSIVNDCFIEVKSYNGKPYFFWSKNEMDIARIKGDNYYLYLVDRNEVHKFGYIPIIIKNPFIEVLNSDKWLKQIDKYKIEFKG